MTRDAIVVATSPVPIVVLEEDPRWELRLLAGLRRCASARPEGSTLLRGVPFSRMEVVLRNGIDRDDPHDPIYAAPEGSSNYRAFDHTAPPRLVLAYDAGKLERSWASLPANATEAQLKELRARYKLVFRRGDGKWWGSLFTGGDAGSSGEEESGYWSPGAPVNALIAVLVVASDVQVIASGIRQSLGTPASLWSLEPRKATEISKLFDVVIGPKR